VCNVVIEIAFSQRRPRRNGHLADAAGRLRGYPTSAMLKKGRIGPTLQRMYEQFFQLPVPLVLVVLWLTGVTLLVACALALYLYVSLLVQV